MANASLSQMSDHRTMPTESPNHWWASSWATVSCASRSVPSMSRPNTDIVWFSSAYPRSARTDATPYSPKGYGPMIDEK